MVFGVIFAPPMLIATNTYCFLKKDHLCWWLTYDNAYKKDLISDRIRLNTEV